MEISEYGKKIIEQERTINAQQEYIEKLMQRLGHLLQSDFIRAFDEIDNRTGKYLINIREADKIAKEGLKNITEYAINIGNIKIE